MAQGLLCGSPYTGFNRLTIMNKITWLALLPLVVACSGPAQPSDGSNEFQANLDEDDSRRGPPTDITDEAQVLISKADELAMQGDWLGAIQAMNKADSVQPENMNILQLRGSLKGHSGDYEGAVLDMDRSIELCNVERQCAFLLLNRAALHKDAGHLDLACRDWKLAGSRGEFDFKEFCSQGGSESNGE